LYLWIVFVVQKSFIFLSGYMRKIMDEVDKDWFLIFF